MSQRQPNANELLKHFVGAEYERVRHFLDVMQGKDIAEETDPLQEASRIFFPGLSARPWYEAAEFPWAEKMAARTPDVIEELDHVLAKKLQFAPYEDAESHDIGYPGWEVLSIYTGGQVIADHVEHCPRTYAALKEIPHGPRQGFFSRLRPGAHIKPHTGGANIVLTCHLGLRIPSDCALRAGSTARTWKTGEVMIFDDSFIHEAWNRGHEDRVVLIWDVWHPELTAVERAALVRIAHHFRFGI